MLITPVGVIFVRSFLREGVLGMGFMDGAERWRFDCGRFVVVREVDCVLQKGA